MSLWGKCHIQTVTHIERQVRAGVEVGGVEDRYQNTVTTGGISSRPFIIIYCRTYKNVSREEFETSMKRSHKETLIVLLDLSHYRHAKPSY